MVLILSYNMLINFWYQSCHIYLDLAVSVTHGQCLSVKVYFYSRLIRPPSQSIAVAPTCSSVKPFILVMETFPFSLHLRGDREKDQTLMTMHW